MRDLTSYSYVYTLGVHVSPKDKTALRLDPGLLDALRAIKARDGIPVTTQIEFAIRDWLKKKGVTVKSPRPRASTRGRS